MKKTFSSAILLLFLNMIFLRFMQIIKAYFILYAYKIAVQILSTIFKN